MAQFSETVDIKRPPEEVWRVLGRPARWFEGCLETRSRSPEYPAPDTRNDHFYRTRMREEVEVRVLGKLAAPIASRDVRNRWATSLKRLKVAVEAGE